MAERNFNLIELGQWGTGKSFVYRESNPNSILVSGGKVTVAQLFVNLSTGRVGLLGTWDTVAFDEVAGGGAAAAAGENEGTTAAPGGPPLAVATGEIVAGGESKWVEFKQTGRVNLHTGRRDQVIEQMVVKTVAGFMNADGGTLLIGVSDTGEVTGRFELGVSPRNRPATRAVRRRRRTAPAVVAL